MELAIKMILNAWEAQNKEFDKLLESLTEEQLAKSIAPGKNTGIYLLGHLRKCKAYFYWTVEYHCR